MSRLNQVIRIRKLFPDWYVDDTLEGRHFFKKECKIELELTFMKDKIRTAVLEVLDILGKEAKDITEAVISMIGDSEYDFVLDAPLEHFKIIKPKLTREQLILQRTPKWLTLDDHRQIKDLYELARLLSSTTCTPHHVDHIIPLQGENVSGLHCPSNLRVITASENCRKSNKFDLEKQTA